METQSQHGAVMLMEQKGDQGAGRRIGWGLQRGHGPGPIGQPAAQAKARSCPSPAAYSLLCDPELDVPTLNTTPPVPVAHRRDADE